MQNDTLIHVNAYPGSRTGNNRSSWWTLLLLVLALAVLSGCAAFAPPRPYTTAGEAIAERGRPTKQWDNGDGTHTLEFSTQPNGYTCLMLLVDAGNIVLRQWDALAPENLARVRVGMDREQISRLLGQHRSVQTFSNSGEEVWDWNIRNDGPGVATLFNVHFIDGKVVRTSQTYAYPEWEGTFGPYWWGPGYPFYPMYGPYPRGYWYYR